MMYHQKFVAVVKVDGKVLRERGDVVTLPFQSEYSLLLKNLESRPASVKVSIDGQDVLYGSSLIISPNEETELMGILHGSQVRNRFKFIKKTSKIQEHRGDKIDDGIIRVEFAYEKVMPKQKSSSEHHYYHYYPPIMLRGLDEHWTSNNVTYTSNSNDNSSDPVPKGSSVVCDSLGGELRATSAFHNHVGSIPQQDEGITVEGSRVNQNFRYSNIGELDDSEVIILRMKGTDGPALTTKTKLTCKTCGTQSKSSAKFCPECGTSLEI